MQVEISQLNVQLFFKEPKFQDQSKLTQVLLGYNFTLGKVGRESEHGSTKTTAFFKDGFRVSVVTSNVLPNRILQIVSFPNSVAEPDQAAQRFLSMISDILLKDLGVSTENDIDACRVVFHSIVKTSKNVPAILASINDVSAVSTLASYAVHKNPFKALQLTQKIGNKLEHDEWQDIRISPFNTNAYVVTIFYESIGMNYVKQFLNRAKNFVSTLINDMEMSVH